MRALTILCVVLMAAYLVLQCQGPSVSPQSQDKFLLLLKNQLVEYVPLSCTSPLCVCVCVCVCVRVCVCVCECMYVRERIH